MFLYTIHEMLITATSTIIIFGFLVLVVIKMINYVEKKKKEEQQNKHICKCKSKHKKLNARETNEIAARAIKDGKNAVIFNKDDDVTLVIFDDKNKEYMIYPNCEKIEKIILSSQNEPNGKYEKEIPLYKLRKH